MKCETCGERRGRKVVRFVRCGCPYALLCDSCLELERPMDCETHRMERYRAGLFDWAEEKAECLEELRRYDARHPVETLRRVGAL